MQNSIGNESIKIACIQTIPGAELEVKSSFEKACKTVGIKKYIFLKGFGTFDIILFYLTEGLGSHLSKAGPIHKVLKSNLFLCYPYGNVNVDKMFFLLSTKLFTGVSLLKINPALQNYFPGIENRLRAFISRNTNWFMLGSLGWNEIILLINENDIDRLCKELFNVGKFMYVENDEPFSILAKTFSFIGMNYKIIPPIEEIRAGFNKSREFLDKNSSLKNAEILLEGSTVAPSLEAAVKPMSMPAIKRYFFHKGFQTYTSLGKQDLIIKPKKKTTWSYFLALVLDFRHRYRGEVFSTSIRLGLDAEDTKPLRHNDIPYRIKPFDFGYADLAAAFGDTMALPLANHFYSFSNLSQNPLCGSAFVDMLDYPPYIKDIGAKLHQSGQDTLHFAQGALEVLRYGAELRSYGTYETIEEITGRFSEFRGGCQQALLAIEFLPSHILGRLGLGWKGFVVTGHHKFFHVNEVINVPTEALWDPQTWWALYHEIGHILIDNRQDWIDYELPSIRQFLANKSNHDYWIRLITELAAEIVGFEFGFFGNYKLFFEQLWNHLLKIDPFQSKNIAVEAYAIRSFFTKIFEERFRRSSKAGRVTTEQFRNLDFLYQELVAHMDLIEKTVNRALFKNKRFLAAENAILFKELYPFAVHLFDKMSATDLRPNMKTLDYENTKKVVGSLSRGRIWLKEINWPEAVLYLLMQQSQHSFSSQVATILSFWNQQMGRIKLKFI